MADPSTPSSSFDLLHPKVQRWIWRQRWQELRDVQEEAIPILLEGAADLVLAAATAAGKTEAAFLPLLSRLAEGGDGDGGVQVLYISPLKALINDQFRRLEGLCEDLAVPVHRWHGDVPFSRKRRVLQQPAGVLIITPESLEALLVRRGPQVPTLLQRLSCIVVDELHAFPGTERGRQLQSLLHRVELTLRRRVPRVGLSATLGDMGVAREFLRPGSGDRVQAIISRSGGQELRMQVRGYRVLPPSLSPKEVAHREGQGEEVALEDGTAGDVLGIREHLFQTLRGGHHLVFANSRSTVEQYADLLRRRCELGGVTNEFWPHHGSLSKDVREETEHAIKDGARPATAVCTSTLELGIDVGAIESIAQIGVPPTVASLRQRLGRSGRQSDPAVLRIYIREPEIRADSSPVDTLRPSLLEAVAMVDLLLEGWCEAPSDGALHLSTLVQQVLSLIAQYGSVKADQAWEALCNPGPFAAVDREMFVRFLRSLGTGDLLTQTHDGELVLGLAGERLVDHYSFYAAFQSAEEYRLIANGRTLGSLPVSWPLFVGLHLIFAGRRWKVKSVDDRERVVELEPAAGGRLPGFLGASTAPTDEKVHRKMFDVLAGEDPRRYLETTGAGLLSEARASFRRLNLRYGSHVRWGEETLLFPWAGDRIVGTLVVWLTRLEWDVTQEGVALGIRGLPEEAVRDGLEKLLAQPPPQALDLAASVKNLRQEKFHPYLADDLLVADFAARNLDVAGARGAIREILERWQSR